MLKEFQKRGKVYLIPQLKNKSQPWIFGEAVGKPAPRLSLANTASGPVCRNHAQIRGAKAEPADRHDETRDKLEFASIPSEENKGSQPQLANNAIARATGSSAS